MQKSRCLPIFQMSRVVVSLLGCPPAKIPMANGCKRVHDITHHIPHLKHKYKRFSTLPPDKQSAEWYKLLHARKEADCGNVIEGQRMQLMTRDICISTLSLLILTLLTVAIFTALKPDGQEYWRIFAVPVLYLSVMFFVTKVAAKNRARRFVELVIREDLIKTHMHECTYRPCMTAECPHCPIV